MCSSLFEDTHLLAKDLLKLNNAANTCLISPINILYHSYPLYS